jgi:hypothetical protein
MGIGGCNKLCPAATRHGLVALFFLSVSIKDRLLLWMVVRSQIYYLEHILTYGSEKTCYSLVMSSNSFRTNWLETGIGGGLSTTLRPGLKRGGLESKFGRRHKPLDRSGMSWSCLCLGYKWDVCFWVPSWATLIRKSPFLRDGMTWLWSDTIVTPEIWKMVKWVWLLNSCWKVVQVLIWNG